jgi:tetratricopeptide (TPR) repeat protein
MKEMPTTPYDLFLSHGLADINWVRKLHAELESKGLRVFLDQNGIEPGDNFVLTIDEALRGSRFLAVVLSQASVRRPWVVYEWTTFKAQNGPLGRIIPVALEALDLPVGLIATQAIDATDRDVVRVANELLQTVGRLQDLTVDDPRLPTIGQELTFVLSSADKGWLEIIMPDERKRSIPAPWCDGGPFEIDIELFHALGQQAIQTQEDWLEIHRCGESIGQKLFSLLFDERGMEALSRAMEIAHTPPVVTLLSAEDSLLARPWELIHNGSIFLVRAGQIDLLRSTVEGSFSRSLSAPKEHFRLLVNVSAPQGHEISYEEESYRISKVLADRCEMASCELGTLDDLITTAARFSATGIHFSGHGAPGVLLFETEENEPHQVPITQLVQRLRTQTPSGLPGFFYLACCHGNTARQLAGGGWETSAARLHREGIAEVVGYFGPIAEHLSTKAEKAFYQAIAAGRTTRFAVRQARLALAYVDSSVDNELGLDPSQQWPGRPVHPFVWSHLAFYRRGPEHALSLAATVPAHHGAEQALQRTFQDAGNRRILITGFVGRRNELHQIRRRLRAGQKAFFFHGLGGVGKTTLAVHLLSVLGKPEDVCALWCQEYAGKSDPARWIIRSLIDFGRERFGDEMDELAAKFERQWSRDLAAQLRATLEKLLTGPSQTVIYLDNIESLLIGPEFEDSTNEFSRWASPELEALWSVLLDYAENSGSLYVLATSRYLNETIPQRYQLPVPPLGRDALFRLTKWFPALQRLSTQTRARLAERLAGHPRAVEFANGLVDYSLDQWEQIHGAWTIPEPAARPEVLEREWNQLVAVVLPDVQVQLESNMLLDAIWDRVLTDRGRRMLYRMSLLRADRWAWPFLSVLGEKDEPFDSAEVTARQLLKASLLGIFDERPGETGEDREPTRFYSLHPSTLAHIRRRFGDDPSLRQETHARVGNILTLFAETDQFQFEAGYRLYLQAEAAYHLFASGDYPSAATSTYEACLALLRYGRNREVLEMIEPFEAPSVLETLPSRQKAMLFDVAGRSHREMKHFELALKFHQQSREAAKVAGDLREEAIALGNLANVYVAMEQNETAIRLWEQAREIARRSQDPDADAIDLGSLGALYLKVNRNDEAAMYLEKALALAVEQGVPTGTHLANLGTLYATTGNYDKAMEYFERAVSAARQDDRPLVLDHALRQIARIRINTDEVGKALEILARAFQIAREIGNVDRQRDILSLLASASSTAGRQSDVIKFSRQAVLLAKDTGDAHVAAKESGRIGLVHHDQGQWEKGIEWFERAIEFSRQAGDTESILVWLGMLSDCLGALGRLDDQVHACRDAVTLARTSSSPDQEHLRINKLGAVYHKAGRPSEAAECFEQALDAIERCEDRSLKIDYLCNLGLAWVQSGQAVQAFALLEREAEACRDSENQQGERRLLEIACSLCQNPYNSERLQCFGADLIRLERRTGNSKRELEVYQILAAAHYRAGAWQEAADILVQAVEAASRLQDAATKSQLLMLLGETYHCLGAIKLEIESCQSLLALARATGDLKCELMCLDQLARLHLSQEEPEKALEYLQLCSIGKNSGECATMSQLANFGAALLHLERASEAIEPLERAAQLARDSGEEKQEAAILANLGNAYIKTGEITRARKTLQTAITLGQAAGHTDAVQVAKELLADLQTTEDGTLENL